MIGNVQLLDTWGNIKRAVDTARVSTGSRSPSPEDDKRLFKYLVDNYHDTPFETIMFRWRVQCPIFIARQWMRHRIGSFNERSLRYTDLEERGETLAPPEAIDTRCESPLYSNFIWAEQEAHQWRQSIIDNCPEGMTTRRKREIARYVLPLSTPTEFIWTVNWRSLWNFLTLRDSSHAQPEMQEFARAVKGQVGVKFPELLEAFEARGKRHD